MEWFSMEYAFHFCLKELEELPEYQWKVYNVKLFQYGLLVNFNHAIKLF